MTPERWEKVGEIFSSASEMDTAEREAYLCDVCGDDTTLWMVCEPWALVTTVVMMKLLVLKLSSE